MDNLQHQLLLILVFLLALPNMGTSQEDLQFEVNRIYPYILITKEELKEAKSLSDLTRHFKPSWVRDYISVEILTKNQGKTIKSLGKNNILNQIQKDRMYHADPSSDITVKVKYMPENTLSHNDPKEHHFTFTVDPETEAKYPGGQQQLTKYLKEKVIDKIPNSSFKGYDLTAVKFTINEEGQIINAHLFGLEYQNATNATINQQLLEAIRTMPCWEPAAYANGTKVKQEFVLTVGNMKNCVINLLNIRRDGLPKNG